MTTSVANLATVQLIGQLASLLVYAVLSVAFVAPWLLLNLYVTLIIVTVPLLVWVRVYRGAFLRPLNLLPVKGNDQ